MIDRIEWLERRLVALEQAVQLAEASAAQARQAAWQGQAGGMTLGGQGSTTLGRASGAISARSGTTLGSGNFNFSTAPSGTLIEGTQSSACKNLLNKTIADDAWLLLVREPDWWVVIAAADCTNLS